MATLLPSGTSFLYFTGPNGDPDGLLPNGVPASVSPKPLGMIENTLASVDERIISSTASSASYFSARACSKFLLASFKY